MEWNTVWLIFFLIGFLFLLVPKVLQLWKSFRKKISKNQKPEESTQEEEEPDQKENPSYYYMGLVSWISGIVFINILYVLPYWTTNVSAKVVGLLLAVWVGDAITILRVNEFCGLTFFGRRTKTFGPGIYVFPRLLFERYIFKSDIYEIFWPAKQDKIFYGDDAETVPPGQSRAWRFLTGAPQVEKSQVPTTKTTEDVSFGNILDVQQFVSLSGFTAWQIQKERLFDLVLASGGETDQVEEQIFSITYGHLSSQVSDYTVAELNKNLKTIADANKAEVQKVLEGTYGVKVITHTLNPPNISHDLAKAQRDANKARAVAVGTKTAADAEMYRLVRIGEGEGEAEKARIKGEGEGIREAADLLNMSPEGYYAGRVATKTLGEGDVTVLGTESIGNMVGGITASLMKGVSGKGKKDKDPASGGEV